MLRESQRGEARNHFRMVADEDQDGLSGIGATTNAEAMSYTGIKGRHSLATVTTKARPHRGHRQLTGSPATKGAQSSWWCL